MTPYEKVREELWKRHNNAMEDSRHSVTGSAGRRTRARHRAEVYAEVLALMAKTSADANKGGNG